MGKWDQSLQHAISEDQFQVRDRDRVKTCDPASSCSLAADLGSVGGISIVLVAGESTAANECAAVRLHAVCHRTKRAQRRHACRATADRLAPAARPAVRFTSAPSGVSRHADVAPRGLC